MDDTLGVCNERAVAERIHELPIGILHLGAGTSVLVQAGFRSVGDLLDATPDSISWLPAIGTSTIDLLQRRLRALFASKTKRGGVDFERYCSEIQIPLIPKGIVLDSGEAFLSALPLVFCEVATHIGDPVLAEILQERLCKSSGEQKTLEQIGQSARPVVSRERIRQKEKKLLSQMVDGLLYDNYTKFNIHFRPEFSQWWRLASESLATKQEISARDFIDLLSSIWQVPHSAIIEQLPIILAIVTGRSTMPTGFRSIGRIDPMWHGGLDPSVGAVPVKGLRIGRYAERLTAAGYRLLDDVVRGIQSGEICGGVSKKMDSFVSHLNIVASCIADNGSLDWNRYQRSLGLDRIPGAPPGSAVQFVQGLVDTIERLLERSAVTKRSVMIYHLRVCRSSQERKTLHQVAKILGTHPPIIKREETIFLKFLNDVLVFGDFSNLPVWLDEQWLEYWSEAASVFEMSNRDYRTFSRNLAWRWRLTERGMRHATPSIWAVLNGYPEGRPNRRSGNQELEGAGEAVGRIKLKGFGRVH